MPKINTDNNPSLEDISASLGNHNAAALRGGDHSISAKTGVTARLGSLWDRVSGRAEDKAQKAEAALASAFKKSTGEFDPTDEQKRMISDIVRGRHPGGVKAGLDALQNQAQQKKEEIAEIKNSSYPKCKQDIEDTIQQISQCKNSQEVDQSLTKLAQLQGQAKAMHGKLKHESPGPVNVADQKNQALAQVEQNASLQGVEKSASVALASMAIKCVDDKGTEDFINSIKEDAGLDAGQQNQVLCKVASHSAKVACLSSQDMGNLARGNDPAEKFLSNITKMELQDVSKAVADKVVEKSQSVNASQLKGGHDRMPGAGTPESQNTPGLEQAYKELAVSGLQQIVAESEKVKPEGKAILNAIKQGGVEAAGIKPELLNDGATPDDLGNQLVASQVALRAVSPEISKRAIALRGSADPGERAQGEMLVQTAVLIQGYDNCQRQETPEKFASGEWAKAQNSTINDIREENPQLLAEYRAAGSKYTAPNQAQNQVVDHSQQQSQSQDLESKEDIGVQADIEVKEENKQKVGQGANIAHVGGGAEGKKVEAPALEEGKVKVKEIVKPPQPDEDPSKLSFQQKRAIFSKK
ncbi:MAG TPA: hypothetical protein DIT64_21825 [Verrucomicrobiales bacterium]|nr:hypothetical protein [Verrucomicrobiales bacterium]